MKASQLLKTLIFAIENRLPILIKGQPGAGKSDVVAQAAHHAKTKLIIAHPVVSDPTDFKGLPYADGKEAHFLPFGDLNRLINATEPTAYFLDDLGQAPPAVQAACMQLILARRINGFKVADCVTFIAATNRKSDKAAVSGILEPVKSRFASIIQLDVDAEDWVKWAIDNNMPTPLIAFIRFRPEILEKFEATKDITNTPSPRTVANVGKLQNAGLPAELEYEIFAGAAGEAFAAEYTGFLKMYRELPNVDSIILDPGAALVPEQPATLYALSGALAARMNDNTIEPICRYLRRLPGEIQVVAMKDAVQRNAQIVNTKAFVAWSVENSKTIL